MLEGSIAGPILMTFAVIGGIISFWFWDASHLTTGKEINQSYSSYLPDVCTILVDRAGEPRKSAQVYVWGRYTRIDLNIVALDNTATNVHAIINPAGTSYVWREDRGDGDILRTKRDYSLIEKLVPTNSWFCFPSLNFSGSNFRLPKTVTFREADSGL